MKNITIEYFALIEELKSKLSENDIVEILNLFDKIKLFWNKNKALIINEIKNKKQMGAIIGGMTYPHFHENHHFIPLANDELLIIDEPFSKMDEIIRLSSVNNQTRILEIINNTIEVFLESKDIILNNNIWIAPLRLYYGLDKESITKLSDKLVYSAFNYMFDVEIENETDLDTLSKQYDTFEKIDNLISTTNRDMLYLGDEYIKLPIEERLKEYHKNGGMDFSKISKILSPIFMIHSALFGYSAQVVDILNIAEITQTNLYLFLEVPAFYFNILLENIFSNDEELYKKYLKTMIAYFLHKCLDYYDYGNLDLKQFNNKCLKYNLLNSIYDDYIKKKCSKASTDLPSIKKFIDIRVKEFLNIKE